MRTPPAESAPEGGASTTTGSRDRQWRLLDVIQREAFNYFLHETNPANGLVTDATRVGSPASIATVGLGLTSNPVAVARGYLTRTAAAKRTLTTLRFLWTSPQGPEPDATGYHGFYYHFLDVLTGARAWQSELSTVDSALLIGGVLTAAAYFDQGNAQECEIRDLAERLYARVDWRWAQNGGLTVTHGWTPESGFLPYRWKGYDEAMLLYVLGLGSPTHPIPPESYQAWAATYDWRTVDGTSFLYAGPLFTHQLSHLWIDFRGIRDAFMSEKQCDYFENSRRATLLQQQYAIQNPSRYVGYGASCWGLTACDGPGPSHRVIDGVSREFYGYVARGVPDGPDDGTLAPWGVVASLPFAPEIVMPTIAAIRRLHLGGGHRYGYKTVFNPTFPDPGGSKNGWVSPSFCGLNQGPIVIMIENFRSGLVWQLLRGCAHVINGLKAAGFTGGWLDEGSSAPEPTGRR